MTEHFEVLEDYTIPHTYRSRTAKLAVFLILSIIILLSWHFLGPRSALAGGGWIDDWDSAIDQSLSSGRPALVLFTADWCPACRQFESETLSDEQVRDYLRKNYTLVVVDLSNRSGPNNKRAMEFKVNAIPTLILFDKSGHEQARGFGMPTNTFLLWLKSGGTAVKLTTPR